MYKELRNCCRLFLNTDSALLDFFLTSKKADNAARLIKNMKLLIVKFLRRMELLTNNYANKKKPFVSLNKTS